MNLQKEKPLISIGMPIFNNENTLERALVSMINQDYTRTEIIVSDDASSDMSVSILKRYENKIPNLKISYNKYNLGHIENLLKVLNASKGKYFVWASGDDYWHPVFLSTLVNSLLENKKAIAAMCATRRVWEDDSYEDIAKFSGNNGIKKNSQFKLARSILMAKDMHGRMIKNNFFIHGILDRDKFYYAIKSHPGIFKERILLCQLALAGEFIYVDKVLFEKTQNGSFKDRHPDDPFSIMMNERFQLLMNSYRLTRSLFFSRIIPLEKKLYVPFLLFYFITHRIHIMIASILKRILPDPINELLRKNYFYRRVVKYYYK